MLVYLSENQVCEVIYQAKTRMILGLFPKLETPPRRFIIRSRPAPWACAASKVPLIDCSFLFSKSHVVKLPYLPL
jgi:hypothetical protein